MENKKAEILLNAATKAIGNTFIEIGCIREKKEVPEDGFSTYYLAKFCKENNKIFKSFDIEKNNVDIANEVLLSHGFDPIVKQQDGKEALLECGPIDFLFLDAHRIPAISYDQYIVAELAKNAIVVIDDAHTFDNNEFGKATYLIYLFKKYNIPYEIKDTCPGFKTAIAYIKDGKKSGDLT